MIPLIYQASGNYIQVDGGAAVIDLAMGDRFIWHNNPLGVRYYLYGETRMRYYLPSD